MDQFPGFSSPGSFKKFKPQLYMKLSIIAVVAALTMAFCTKEKTARSVSSKAWPYYYWTYIGDNQNYFQQQNPEYYILDENQFPDCLNTMGHTRCSIKAAGDAWIEGQPDLSTIQSVWYRPL